MDKDTELREEYDKGQEVYEVYCKAVGTTWDGKPLPEYVDLGSQRAGWIAITKKYERKENEDD